MKVDRNNIQSLPIIEFEKSLLNSLFIDLDEINRFSKETIYINYQDWHDEYSPERVDPCPDYYGMFFLSTDSRTIGDRGTITDLDDWIYVLYDYIVNL